MDPADAWRRHAAELAARSTELFVPSDSEWIAFLPLKERDRRGLSVERTGSMNTGILERHFRGADQGHLVGSPWRSMPSRMGIPIQLWLGFDVRPESRGPAAVDVARHSAQRLVAELREAGLPCLVEDYDGSGNFHVWVLPELGCLGDWEAGPWPDAAERWARGILTRLELPSGLFAEHLPLPGRHHTFDHWSRFHDGSEWLDGEDAVRLLLEWQPITVERFRAAIGREAAE